MQRKLSVGIIKAIRNPIATRIMTDPQRHLISQSSGAAKAQKPPSRAPEPLPETTTFPQQTNSHSDNEVHFPEVTTTEPISADAQAVQVLSRETELAANETTNTANEPVLVPPTLPKQLLQISDTSDGTLHETPAQQTVPTRSLPATIISDFKPKSCPGESKFEIEPAEKGSKKRTLVATPRVNKRPRKGPSPTRTRMTIRNISYLRDSVLTSSHNGLSKRLPPTAMRQRSRPATVPQSTSRARIQSRIPLPQHQVRTKQALAPSSSKTPASNAPTQTSNTQIPRSVRPASYSKLTPTSPPISFEESLPIAFEPSRPNSPQFGFTAPEIGIKPSSPTPFSDPEKVYLPFLKRLTGASTSEILDLSVKEFIAGVLLGHHTQTYDIPYMTMPYISETHRHLCFFNRSVKCFQIRYHKQEPDRKRDQKTCPYGCFFQGYQQHLSGTTYVYCVIFLLML